MIRPTLSSTLGTAAIAVLSGINVASLDDHFSMPEYEVDVIRFGVLSSEFNGSMSMLDVIEDSDTDEDFNDDQFVVLMSEIYQDLALSQCDLGEDFKRPSTAELWDLFA